MTNRRFEHRHLQVACDLQGEEVGARVDAWQRLREEAGLGVESIPGGARVWLSVEAFGSVEALARSESACCGFLDLDLVVDAGRVRLDITSDAPGAEAVIASLVGMEPRRSDECC